MSNNNFIPYGKHFLDQDDIDSVVEVLKNGMLTQGPKIEEFENLVAKQVNAKYAIAVSSGTAALHLACKVVGLSSGDQIITSANTFVAKFILLRRDKIIFSSTVPLATKSIYVTLLSVPIL